MQGVDGGHGCLARVKVFENLEKKGMVIMIIFGKCVMIEYNMSLFIICLNIYTTFH